MSIKDNHNELLNLIAGQGWHLDRLYSQLAKDLAPILRKYKNFGGRAVWKGNEKIRAEIRQVLKAHNIRLTAHIENKILQGWNLAHSHSDNLVKSYTKGMDVSKPLSAAMLYRNTSVIDAYLKYGRDKKLSKRVWNITKETEGHIKRFLQEGLAEGRSAVDLTKDLRQYLKEPDRRFRRIRDKNGKLILSNAAKNYNPGRGVYRSSYKNALRLARNEINIGYRMADVERRKRMPFVMGVAVCLSPAHPAYDICDELVGDYPSNYVFTGFHPNCLCYTKSKLLPKSEFKKYLQTGKIPEKYRIKGVDAKRLQYVSKNKEKLKGLYFFRDNKELWDSKVKKKAAILPQPKRKLTALERSKLRQAKRSNEQRAEIQKKWDERKRLRRLKTHKVNDTIPANIQNYEKELGVKIDRDIFYLLEKDTPLVFENLKGINAEGAYYSPFHNAVRIPIDARRKQSKWKAASVVYHEYGHAIDAHIGLRESKKVKSLMRQYKKELDFAKIDRQAKLKYLDARKKGDFDSMEKTGAVLDTIMSLNPKYGIGHTKTYYRKKGNKEAEFIAHCFENTFTGNDIFKELMPGLYKDTINLIRGIKSK